MIDPHWEHGYRCHGFWLGTERIGFIGLPHTPANRDEYRWSFDLPRFDSVKGRTKTLREAKKNVEKAYKTRLEPRIDLEKLSLGECEEIDRQISGEDESES